MNHCLIKMLKFIRHQWIKVITKIGEKRLPDPFANFTKAFSIVQSMSQSDPGMNVRASPSTPLSIKFIAPGCVNSRFVK